MTKAKRLMTIAFLLFATTNAQAQLKLYNGDYTSLTECDTMSRGIFLVWWDKDFNYASKVSLMLDSLAAIRKTCLNDLNMQDPQGVQNGYYCNIFIHTWGNPNDYFNINFPGLYNGVGLEGDGHAYMETPNITFGDWSNLAHEGFHIFQIHGLSKVTPGIRNTKDGGWHVEATASWFANKRFVNQDNSFLGSETVVSVPHVPLWLSYGNFPQYYPNNWQRNVRQYGLSTYLYYLTSRAGVADTVLTNYFYSGSTYNGQEYLYRKLGAAKMRKDFIDCAAHMTNNFDFILPKQYTTSVSHYNTYASPTDRNKYVQTFDNTGSNGWFAPTDSITTNAWSFNTYKLLNTSNDTYTFDLDGDMTGTYGDNAHFQGKVLVQNSTTGASFHDIVMINSTQGSLSLNLTTNDTAVYFIIASMPEYFVDTNATFQLFPYQMRITKDASSPTSDYELPEPKYEIARYNIMGQKVNAKNRGVQIIQYSDGSTRKVFNWEE